jgi:hypothetical protein
MQWRYKIQKQSNRLRSSLNVSRYEMFFQPTIYPLTQLLAIWIEYTNNTDNTRMVLLVESGLKRKRVNKNTMQYNNRINVFSYEPWPSPQYYLIWKQYIRVRSMRYFSSKIVHFVFFTTICYFWKIFLCEQVRLIPFVTSPSICCLARQYT